MQLHFNHDIKQPWHHTGESSQQPKGRICFQVVPLRGYGLKLYNTSILKALWGSFFYKLDLYPGKGTKAGQSPNPTGAVEYSNASLWVKARKKKLHLNNRPSVHLTTRMTKPKPGIYPIHATFQRHFTQQRCSFILQIRNNKGNLYSQIKTHQNNPSD